MTKICTKYISRQHRKNVETRTEITVNYEKIDYLSCQKKKKKEKEFWTTIETLHLC